MTRRPRKLENNVFVLNTPERILLKPGETQIIKMKIKIHLSKNSVGCCTLLQTFSVNVLKLLNSQHISRETNTANLCQPVDLPWYLTLEIFNQNINTIFQINKKQELGFFHILNDGVEEIRYIYKKNTKNTIVYTFNIKLDNCNPLDAESCLHIETIQLTLDSNQLTDFSIRRQLSV